MINIGTFCSGVGSPEQALKDLGINYNVKFACDIDKYAKITYQANHESELFFDDLSKINYKELPDVNIFVAGFPCQPFSLAGKRLGFDDTRGTLFFKIHDYLNIKKPDVFILENVKGLLSHDEGYTFDLIIQSLAKSINGNLLMFTPDYCLNYHVYYAVLNATDFNIPQNRERIFIIGFKNDNHSFKWPEKQKSTLKLKDLLETNIQDKYYISQKMLDSIILNAEKQKNKGSGFQLNIIDKNQHSANTIRAMYSKIGTSDTLIKESKKNHQGLRVNNTNISVTLASNAGGGGAKTGLYAVPVLTPDRPIKRQNGRRFKENNDPSFTITAQDKHGVFDGHKIRKLTPRECFRLMGFPDSFIINKVSETQQYKQAGNSIVVDVMRAILKEVLINFQVKYQDLKAV